MQAAKVSAGGSASPPRVQAALNLLRNQHERVTRARQAVIEVLDGTKEHLAADEIVARAEASAPGSSPGDGLSCSVDTRGTRAGHPHSRRWLGNGLPPHHARADRPSRIGSARPSAVHQLPGGHRHPRGCPGFLDQPRRSRGWLPSRAASCSPVGPLRRLPAELHPSSGNWSQETGLKPSRFTPAAFDQFPQGSRPVGQ